MRDLLVSPDLRRDDTARMSPRRAEACERLARGIGFVHPCPTCAAEALPGSVCGFVTEDDLRRHRFEVHGETGGRPCP